MSRRAPPRGQGHGRGHRGEDCDREQRGSPVPGGCRPGPPHCRRSLLAALRRSGRPVHKSTVAREMRSRQCTFSPLLRADLGFSRLVTPPPGFRCYEVGVMMSPKAAPLEGEQPIAMGHGRQCAGYRGRDPGRPPHSRGGRGTRGGRRRRGTQSLPADPGRPGAVHRRHAADVRQPEGLGRWVR